MDEKLKGSFRVNLLIVLVLCVALYMLFFSSLGWITKHGSEANVPNVTGSSLKPALEKLEKMGFDVSIDSAYDPQQKPLAVLAQVPDPNSVVKNGRTIFLTINKTEPPLTPMPKLTDLSYRSAVMILKSSRLVLGDTVHKPNYANGAVLDQLYKGRPIRPGDMLPQGSRVSLVIGDGLGSVDMNVPDVIGMTAEEGINILSGNGLSPTVIWDDEITDSASAVIYVQTPAPYNELDVANRIREGDVVDIRIRQNPSQEEMDNNRRPAKPVIEEEQELEKEPEPEQ
jgi:beta-lactam-binding protein with PASTA domain